MPKRETYNLTSDSIAALCESDIVTYYCVYCGEYVVILDLVLELLRRRKTDGSFAVDPLRQTHKHNMSEGAKLLIRRSKGAEMQYMWRCKGCHLDVAYQPVPWDQKSDLMYFLPGAISVSSDLKVGTE
eukprot:gene2501-3248_t